MDAIFGILLIAVCILGVFAIGIIVGISDCKRTYGIPPRKSPDNVEWFIKSDEAITVPKWEWEQLCEIESAYIAMQTCNGEVDDGCIYP